MNRVKSKKYAIYKISNFDFSICQIFNPSNFIKL